MLAIGTRIRTTKLVNFSGRTAEFHYHGINYTCIRRRGHYFTVAAYTYL